MTFDHWRDLRARLGDDVAEDLARDYVETTRQYVAELAATARAARTRLRAPMR